MRDGKFVGGLFMASSVSDSCHLYNALVPPQLIRRGGDVEHLRTVLDKHFPGKPISRARTPSDPTVYYEHAGMPYGHMHEYDHDSVGAPISLQAGELVWFTDRTPHESVPLRAGQHRQFFRLVTGGIDTWYAAHSTPNPLGIQPQAKRIVHYNKFTGREAEPEGEC